ncbi:MAG TPA: flagellar biosynthesis protein FlhB [Clostridia bacterium]|nr:flagellar biosynthesis protein FlhB [Clostridia bacterium]
MYEEIVQFNLQLFSEEKTEEATPKKKRDARKKGQVPVSKDLSASFVLLFIFIVINIFSGYFAENFYTLMYYVDENIKRVDELYELGNLLPFFNQIVYLGVKIGLPLMLTALSTGLIFSYIQVGALFTIDPIKPKLSKINPIEGFKKMFSLKSLVELGKSLAKSAILVIYSVYYLNGRLEVVVKSIEYDVATLIAVLWDVVYNLVLRISLMLIVLAVLDYFYKRWQHNKDIKMTKKEVKDEYKESEGDPMLKSKIRQKQREMSASRMMQEVPDADVVITNPTHFANAIKYNNDSDSVPKVVAKGRDLIANNIKKIAKEHDIPIVENKPLAREIYKVVEIGDEIPPDLYHAVAEVLAYVYELKK